MENILNLQLELENELVELSDNSEKCRLIKEYVNKLDTDVLHEPVEDFGYDLEWLNVLRPLSLKKDLSGKVVVLDFFTYCCINCMHILPLLHRLEERFPPTRGLVVAGIHSAKFDNEKIMANVADAVLRYNISHPVANDPEGRLWNKMGICCWPTLVILGPDGKMLFMLLGEGREEDLIRFCLVALEYYDSRGRLTSSDLPTSPLCESATNSALLFPGKICCDSDGKQLFVCDTGHHRLLVLSLRGVVREVIGGQQPGLRDGAFENALFHSPQGLAFYGDENVVFVADTNNHCVRKVDLTLRTVTTICGTGKHGSDREGGNFGTQQALSSPWDLCLAPAIGSLNRNIDTLYIAMAGLHQIWAYFLKDTNFYKIGSVKAGICMAVAGSGSEENRNNRYPTKAGFAQPSGLTAVDCDGKRFLVVADSESSSIRSVSLNDGSVGGLVGGESNPTDLFAFGDRDGVGFDAKLQHPLGICWSFSNKLIYFVDSYNHKIKSLNMSTRECQTYAGTGQVGGKVEDDLLSSAFSEPGGIEATETHLYIADTNNHCIKTIDLKSNILSELPIVFVSDTPCDSTDNSGEISSSVPREYITPVSVLPGGRLVFLLTLTVGGGLHLNEDSPQSWSVHLQDKDLLKLGSVLKGKLDPQCKQHRIELLFDSCNRIDAKSKLELKVRIFLCTEDSCLVKERIWKTTVTISRSCSENVEICLPWDVEK